MSQQWYCRVGNVEYGPISSATLHEWVLARRLAPEDWVRLEGGKWLQAKQVNGLNWPSPPAHAAPPAPPAVASEAAAVGEPAPAIRIDRHKSKRLGKTPTSVWAIFDWRFEYYLTPWIIRVLWVIFLVLTAIGLVLGTIELVVALLPDVSNSSLSTSPSSSGWNSPPARSSSWELPRWMTQRLFKIVMYVVWVLGTIVGVLVTRMLMELMIVVFRIAEDIGVLKRKYAEE